MTQDEIIEMAILEAEFVSHGKPSEKKSELFVCIDKDIVRFANIVAAKATEEANARANASWTLMCKKMVAFEREACAKVCESYLSESPYSWGGTTMAAAIRARGEQA